MIRLLAGANALLNIVLLCYLWGKGEGPLAPYISAVCGWAVAWLSNHD